MKVIELLDRSSYLINTRDGRDKVIMQLFITSRCAASCNTSLNSCCPHSKVKGNDTPSSSRGLTGLRPACR